MLSVVIPVYNLGNAASGYIRRFIEAMSFNQDIEVFVIDNGSTDGTAMSVSKELESAQETRIRLIKLDKKLGDGEVILKGLAQAIGDVLAWAGPEMDPREVLIAFESYRLHNSTDVFVKGVRKGLSILNLLKVKMQNIMANFLLEVKLNDIYSGPKVCSRDFYNKYLRNSGLTDSSIELYAVYWGVKTGWYIETDTTAPKKGGYKQIAIRDEVTLSGLLKAIRQIHKLIRKSSPK